MQAACSCKGPLPCRGAWGGTPAEGKEGPRRGTLAAMLAQAEAARAAGRQGSTTTEPGSALLPNIYREPEVLLTFLGIY